MEKRELRRGEVVQIDPDFPRWGGCYLTVTEPKSSGAKGYVKTPEGHELVTLKFAEMEPTGGIAQWADIENYDNANARGVMQMLLEAVKAGRDALLVVMSPAIDSQLPADRSRKAHSAIDDMARAMREAGLK